MKNKLKFKDPVVKVNETDDFFVEDGSDKIYDLNVNMTFRKRIIIPVLCFN
jgi:hypothetical protein